MAELLLATALITVVLLTVAGVFLSIFRSQEKSSHGETGAVAAETVLNSKLHNIFAGVEPGLTKADFFANNSPPATELSGNLLLAGTEYQYRVDYETVVDSSGVALGSSLPENRLKLVRVTCWWWNAAPGDTRQGYGKQSYTLQRLVNENDGY